MNWDLLVFLAQTDHVDSVCRRLYCAKGVGQKDYLGDSQERFSAQAEKLLTGPVKNSHLPALFALNVISHLLVADNHGRPWESAWALSRLPMAQLLAPLSWQQAVQGRWALAPVLLTADPVGCRYFVLGCLPEPEPAPALWPAWASNVMDPACRAAISVAAELAGKKTTGPCAFFAFPLTAPTEGFSFTGASLGLPLALGFLMTGAGITPPADLVASGRLDKSGHVLAVQQRSAKIACAAEAGYKAVILPANGPAPKVPEAIALLPAAHLDDAWMFARLYAPGRTHELLRLADMLASPDRFVHQVDTVDPLWLDGVRRQGKWDRLLPQVVGHTGRLTLLLDKMAGCLQRGDVNAAQAIGDLIPGRQLAPLSGRCPSRALRLCTLKLALADQRDDVGRAIRWAASAETLIAAAAPIDPDGCADFFNSHLANLHHRFAFDPVLPAPLLALIDVLEKRRQALAAAGCWVDKPLAALCGTLVQHFGFCGPSFWPRSLQWAARCRQALGEARVSETREELARLSGWLVPLHLDAGRVEAALDALMIFLGEGCWLQTLDEAGLVRLNCWQHVALARFLAETGSKEARGYYMMWAALHHTQWAKPVHPWQLWCWNLGRMALLLDEVETARGYFELSLALCLAPAMRSTVKVMALLPLAGLHASGSGNSALAAGWQQARKAAAQLNPTHFARVLEQPCETLLAQLWEQPRDLFPFSYR